MSLHNVIAIRCSARGPSGAPLVGGRPDGPLSISANHAGSCRLSMIAPGRFAAEALCCPVWLLSPRSWSSRMRLPPFLPHLKGLYLAEIAVTEEGITLRLFVA